MKTVKEIKEVLKEVLGDTVKVHSIATINKDIDYVKRFTVLYGTYGIDTVTITFIDDHLHKVEGIITIYDISQIISKLAGK